MDRYIAFIPVRGGSKSIPLKNIQEICGRPLVYWTLDAAVDCQEIDRVYLCTDSPQIREKVVKYIAARGCKEKLLCIDRPAETATDTASTESSMLYFGQTRKDFEHIILIQATSPLLKAEQLSAAITYYEKEKFDSLLSVVRQKKFCWRPEGKGYVPINYNFYNRPRRQEFDGYLVENGAFYINTRKNLLRDKCRLSGRVGTYEMEEESYFEIDEPSDWLIIESLLARRISAGPDWAGRAKAVKMVLTDCDGVLTDGGMYYSENGDELKRFNTKDGMAVQMLQERGIRFGIITGERINLVRRRAEKMKADECWSGIGDKLAVVNQICEKYGLTYGELAYLGDDCNDVAVLKEVGFPCSVPNGMPEARNAAVYVTKTPGGSGALREVAELILRYKETKE